MTTTIKSAQPAWRLGFAPRTGTDRNGQPILGYPIEVGAVFARREAEKGFVAKFAIIPADLKDGVLLLMPVTTNRREKDLFTQDEPAENHDGAAH
jgi:hypothetical protein